MGDFTSPIIIVERAGVHSMHVSGYGASREYDYEPKHSEFKNYVRAVREFCEEQSIKERLVVSPSAAGRATGCGIVPSSIWQHPAPRYETQ